MGNLDMEWIRKEAEKIKLKNVVNEAAEQSCENCGQLLADHHQAWIRVERRGENEPTRTLYCSDCISVKPRSETSS